MGQHEVYEWLLQERMCGNDLFFSIKEIRDALKAQGKTPGQLMQLSNDVLRLQWYGALESQWKGKAWNGDWSYRLKKKHVVEAIELRRRDAKRQGHYSIPLVPDQSGKRKGEL